VKNEQHLLVDFGEFPSKLTELLELALNCSKEDKI